MKTILITGGGGFIGSHTCLVLLEKGYNLIVLDSLINSSIISLERVSNIIFNKKKTEKLKVFKGDIRDKKLLENIFDEAISSKNEIDAVIHFAGLKSVGESVSNPLRYWEINVGGSVNLFSVMNKYDCRTIVFSSSATVYAKSDNNELLNEESNINPSNPYGETKITIEKILFQLYESSKKNWKIINLRYFNPIGAHPSGLIGENPTGIPNNIFPFITQVALKKIQKLKIFGNDWNTNDGTGVRDYIHVMDLAEGHVLALENLLEGSPKVINLNLGTAKGSSVLDLVKTFEKTNKINIPFVFTERRPGDIGYVVANNSSAKSILNWFPTRTIEDMCRDGWNWQVKNPNGFE